MAKQFKKKPKPLSREEQVYVQKKLDEYKTMFAKPIKGEIVLKSKTSGQEWVVHARYNDEKAIEADAQSLVASINSINNSNVWIISHFGSIGQAIEDQE